MIREVQVVVEETVRKGWARVIMAVAVLIAIYLISSLLFSFWPFSSAARVVQKVTSAEAIIGNYEWFYSMKAEIDATRMKYQIAEKSKLSEADGILMVLNSMIAEYNAKSRMKSRNLWKASDLPYQIELEAKE